MLLHTVQEALTTQRKLMDVELHIDKALEMVNILSDSTEVHDASVNLVRCLRKYKKELLNDLEGGINKISSEYAKRALGKMIADA